MQEELRNVLHELTELENRGLEFVNNAPEGKLRCAINKGNYQYYIGNVYQGKEKRKIVKKIDQKEYWQKMLPCIKKQKMAFHNLVMTLDMYKASKRITIVNFANTIA